MTAAFGHRDSPVIVVLGCALVSGEPSPALANRLDLAVRVWREALAAGQRLTVIVTGGTPRAQHGGSTLSEASVMRRYLISAGVDPTCIAADAQATTTEENFLHVRHMLASPSFERDYLGIDPVDAPPPSDLPWVTPQPGKEIPAIVVTSHTHGPRAWLMARALGFRPTMRLAPIRPIRWLKEVPREIGALALWGARAARRGTARGTRDVADS